MATPAVPGPEAVSDFRTQEKCSCSSTCEARDWSFEAERFPLDLIEPESLRWKVEEPLLILGKAKFAQVDIRIRVRGGGTIAQIYAIRQAIAKGLVAFYQKYVDEQSKKDIKEILLSYDRTLLVADPRRCEPKKFGGHGARARFQKSYR
eukprot:jgi/Botrbrau1/23407/Bobra.0051s0051.1